MRISTPVLLTITLFTVCGIELDAADVPFALSASDDALFSGAAPVAVTNVQAKIGGGNIIAGNALGIGTSTPTYPLTVQPASYPMSFLGRTSAADIGLISYGQFAKLTFGGGEGGIGMGVSASGSSLFFGTSNNYTNGITNSALVIDPNGNLGVGTVSPSARLSIQDATYQNSFTGLGTTVGIGNGIQNNSFAKLTFGNNYGNAAGIGAQITGGGSYLHLGTSDNYAAGITNSAMVIDPHGNVGVGTSAPVARFHAAQGSSSLYFKDSTNAELWLQSSSNVYSDLHFATNAADQVSLRGSTYGLNVTGPVPHLSINAPDALRPESLYVVGNTATLGSARLLSSPTASTVTLSLDAGANGLGARDAQIRAVNNGSNQVSMEFYVANANSPARAMAIAPNGYVGIGMSPGASSLLCVNGTISAKEIKVVAVPADYVFADGYRLRPLAEVEAFITAHKHLPGVPSAKEQEEQGEMVADLMRAHLEKIEELNLYVIQQQKVIDDLVVQQKAAAQASARQDAALAQVLAALAAIKADRGERSAASP